MSVEALMPLNLAYLIEVAIVVNLSYLELNTYKFRHEMKELADRFLRQYKDEKISGISDELLKPEWGYLEGFHTGANKDAWEHKLKRGSYEWFIFDGKDKIIARGILVGNIIALLICTYYANHTIESPFGGYNWVWGIYCGLLALSIFYPLFLMWLIRSCREYAFGASVAEYLDGNIALPTSGRMYDLSQEVLNKITATSTLVNNKSK
ncbi:MAG: hypothetical protein HFP81_03595 [Methylococcales symbiont of Hymedesmia sp. n. MRB-2018]|nr:MAG: hypothetical protein HFP81_03595 [Methylococcales symbiont of Hymedesmia sp. n. MRB-2018]